MLRNKTGFTLIELLIVIAIIGILSGIVLTTIGRVRISARAAQRVAILRDFSIALETEYTTIQQYPSTCTTPPNAPSQPCNTTVGAIRVRNSCANPNDYVPLLVADGVMPELPHDPQESCPSGINNNPIQYASNGIDYMVIIFTNEGCNQGVYASFCEGVPPGERVWVFKTPGALNWPETCTSQFLHTFPHTCI